MAKKNKEELNTKLDEALKNIEKQFGSGVITNLEEDGFMDIECVSTGSLSVDSALGKGIPKGRIIEFYGQNSSGKTLLALSIIAEVQKKGGKAVFLDLEYSFDKVWAKKNGVNTKDLIFCQPSFAEEALSIVEELTESGEVDLIVVDSVASLVCKAELEGDIGQSHMGLTARLMSQALRKLTGVVSKTGTTIIFINQMRANIGIMYGPKMTTTGGNALSYYSSIRCELKRTETVKKGDDILATKIEVNVRKNKIAAPYKKGYFDIYFDTGICRASDLINIAIENGVISKSGAWFMYGEEKFQGLENLRNHIKDSVDVQDKLREEINNVLETKRG